MARSTRTTRPARRAPGALGTVEQLPSGRWRAFYRRDAERFTAPGTFPTKADALGWLAAERADRTRGVWHDPRAGRTPLETYAREWLDARPALSPRTRQTYLWSLERWVLPALPGTRLRPLGQQHVAELTPAAVRAWYAAVFTAAQRYAADRQARAAERETHPARAWAEARGLPVAATGRLSPAVLAAWRAAGAPRPSTPRRPVVPPEVAGRTAASQAYRVLRAILSTAVEDGLLQTNPCRIAGAGVVHHRERTTASPAEVTQLAARMPAELAAAVQLAAWSGLRYGELFALARRHVDLRAGTVRVERALVCLAGKPITFGPTKTARSNRLVNLPGFLLELLEAHLLEHVPSDPDALLFATDTGLPVANTRLSRLFRAARAGIGREELTWHDLRHTGATLAYQAGASLPDVQARLGHTTLRAATIYAHRAEEADRGLAARLDALVAGLASAGPRSTVASAPVESAVTAVTSVTNRGSQ